MKTKSNSKIYEQPQLRCKTNQRIQELAFQTRIVHIPSL